MSTLAGARAKLKAWHDNPLLFVRQCLKAEPDPWQAAALLGAARHNRLALVACKNPGKTAVLAWLVLWFLVTRPHAKIGCVAVTGDNLRDNLWAELGKWRARSPFLQAVTTWTKTRLFVNEAPETWFATARQWPKKADPQAQADALAGLHADYVMFVLDESGSIPQAVMVTAEAVLGSGIEAKVVQAGNPTSPEGPLYRAAVTDRHLWHVVRVTGDPDDPKRAPRVALEWARQQIATYGRENPWVMVNVLGQFPPAAFNALFGVDEVERAQHGHLRPDAYAWAQKRLGIDVARFGDDRTVLFPRQGLAAFMPTIMRHQGAHRLPDGRWQEAEKVSNVIAGAALNGVRNWGAEIVLIDATGGWGAGARDILATGGVTVIEVQAHAPAFDPRYANRRAECWFAGSEWVRRGGVLPPVPELVGELTTPTYTFNHQGKFIVEAKDQVKERLGRSPDLADGLMQTFGLPDMPGGSSEVAAAFAAAGGVETDFDPYPAREG